MLASLVCAPYCLQVIFQVCHVPIIPAAAVFNDEKREPVPSCLQVNSWVYPGLNNGVYRSGFATQQGAYEEAFR